MEGKFYDCMKNKVKDSLTIVKSICGAHQKALGQKAVTHFFRSTILNIGISMSSEIFSLVVAAGVPRSMFLCI